MLQDVLQKGLRPARGARWPENGGRVRVPTRRACAVVGCNRALLYRAGGATGRHCGCGCGSRRGPAAVRLSAADVLLAGRAWRINHKKTYRLFIGGTARRAGAARHKRASQVRVRPRRRAARMSGGAWIHGRSAG